jgi:hypothetical protein
MKLENVSAVAELVSSVAVVATLIYLALQTQQTNQALFSNSRAQLMSADVQMAIELADSPLNDSIREFVKAYASNPNLTDVEVAAMAREGNLIAGLIRIREFAYFQFQDGLLDERAWDGYANTLVRILQSGSGQIHWERFRPELDAGFAADMDARLDFD